MFTTLYNNFSDAQGQITPESMMVSGRNLISSKLSCMPLIPARMKMIQLKTRIDVYETSCPQQMLVHKGGKIKNWGGECRDDTPTKSLSQNIRVDVLGGGGGGGGGGRVGGSGWM